jgi:hypothetical protein
MPRCRVGEPTIHSSQSLIAARVQVLGMHRLSWILIPLAFLLCACTVQSGAAEKGAPVNTGTGLRSTAGQINSVQDGSSAFGLQ